MPFKKITQEEISKLQSITATNRRMHPDTREDLEAFKALPLDSESPEDALTMEVPTGKERTKVRATILTKFKAYLSEADYAQVDLYSPMEDRTVLVLRKRTPKQN